MSFLPSASPESMGVRSGDIARFVERLSQNEPFQDPHALILVRHGHVLAEGYFAPFDQSSRHSLFSVSKSFVSTAVGFAVQEGLIALDERIADAFPEYLPEMPAPEFRVLTVRHLLMMATGQEGVGVHMTLSGVDCGIPEAFFRAPFLDAPGTTFRYSSAVTYMLSRLILKRAGVDVVAYLTPRLFDPLGIERPYTRRCPEGVPLGYTGMRLSARDIALYGEFYLKRGMWNGKQLLDPAWIDLATQKHVDTHSSTGDEWSQGYCFQFWRGSHNTYRFCGANGQMCICMPDLDALCVVQSGYDYRVLQYVVDSFYETIYSGMRDEPYPEDEPARKRLNTLLDGLMLPVLSGNFSPLCGFVNGVSYTSDAGALTLQFTGGAGVLTYTIVGKPYTLAFGLLRPMRAPSTLCERYALEPQPDDPADAFGYWETLRTLCITARIIPTPTVLTLSLTFTGEQVRMELRTYRGTCDAGTFFTGIRAEV